ncbi:MAG: exosortase/archaeosortase family protein [Verrucomicrobiota bacterium]
MKELRILSEAEVNDGAGDNVRPAAWWSDRRLTGYFTYVGLLSLAFGGPLVALGRYALKRDIHSYILLIPWVSLYLASLKPEALLRERRGSANTAVGWASIHAIAAVSLFLGPSLAGATAWSQSAVMTQAAFCYVLLLVAGGFAFLGVSCMRVLAFPFAFLMFMVPLPDIAIAHFEDLLMRGSVGLADILFQLTGTPVLRNGQVVELPGMTLDVTRNCSGIRSSLVLFITSLIASYMFLSSTLHRSYLMAMVIPLGIFRNAIRVFVIGQLCVHIGPHMIDSWIHHKGGPLFFVVSLAPLFVAAAWFRQRETKAGRAGKGTEGSTVAEPSNR